MTPTTAPPGAEEARRGGDVAGSGVTAGGGVGRIRARHEELALMYGGEPWDESCVEDGEQAHIDRGDLLSIIAALETENAQHVNAGECLRQERESDKNAYQACFHLQQRQVEELVLALMWCKPRLKQEAYQKHIEWTLTKYPKPPKVDEPRVVQSESEWDHRDWCQSDPRGPGRSGP